jgi:hypothetical protein
MTIQSKPKELIKKMEELINLDDKKREKLEQLYLYALILEHFPEVKDGGRFYVTTQKNYKKLYGMMSSQARIFLKGIGLWDKKSDNVIIVKIKEQGYKYDKSEYVLVKPNAELKYFKENSERVISFGEPKK